MNLRMMCSTPLKLRAVSNPTARASHARISRREWSAWCLAWTTPDRTNPLRRRENRANIASKSLDRRPKCRNEVPWKAATCPTRVQRGVVTRVGFGFDLEGHARLRGVRERQPEVDLSVLMAVFAVSVRANVSRGRARLESQRGWTLDVESRSLFISDRTAQDESATQAGHDDVLDEPVEGWEDSSSPSSAATRSARWACAASHEPAFVSARDPTGTLKSSRRAREGSKFSSSGHVPTAGPARRSRRATATRSASAVPSSRHLEHLRLAERVGESAAGGDGAGVALSTLAVNRAVRRRTQDGGARRVHRRGRHAGVTARNWLTRDITARRLRGQTSYPLQIRARRPRARPFVRSR